MRKKLLCEFRVKGPLVRDDWKPIATGIEMTQAPEVGEPISLNGETFRVYQRMWKISSEDGEGHTHCRIDLVGHYASSDNAM